MNEQPHFRKHDRIITADDVELGQVVALFHRRQGADPELKLYADYFKVFDFSSGGVYYIPLDFLDTQANAPGAARLSLTLRQVQEATFNRMPTFVAWREADLPPLVG